MKLLRVLLRTKEKGLSFLSGVLLTRKVPSAESIFFECKVISFLLTKYVKTSQNSLFAEKVSRQVKVSFQYTIEGETVFSRHDLFSL